MAVRKLGIAAVGVWSVTCCTAAQAAPNQHPFPHEAAEAGRWGLIIAVAALLLALPVLLWLLGFTVHVVRVAGSKIGVSQDPGRLNVPFVGIAHGAIIGADRRVSTSKTVAVAWTYAVAGGLLSLVIAKWMGHGHAYGEQVKHGLQGAYALLIGGPIGAAILARGIVSTQVDRGASKPAASSAQAADIVTNDSGDTDLGDLQYVLFNTVALVFFFGEFWAKPQLGLPTIPDVLLGLTSVSAVGYVAKKSLASGALRVVKVAPPRAHTNDVVTLFVSGLADPQGVIPATTDVTVDFGPTPALPQSITTSDQGPILTVAVPDQQPAGPCDVTVIYQGQKSTLRNGLTVDA
ncbi:MAG: hypothetical protein QOD66_2845 [Solirubrobacteraceae bacterium]|nr:hypothetical protein [Solirubrobacteraceae bacterium]